MLKRLCVSLIICLGLVLPRPALASELDSLIQAAGLEVAVDPSQASASALIQLPSVYALPGTFTYWLKTVIEEIQYLLAASPEDRAALLLDFSQARLAEGYQAIQQGNIEAAIQSLQRYADDQQELSNYLNVLQTEDKSMDGYLQKVQQQLTIQQALHQYVEQQVKDTEVKARISSLLQVQPTQILVFKTEQNRVVLGQKNRRPNQATQSATPSATPLN